jgi:glycosyltransferase involved in cell wall biosynthesis
MTSSYQSTLATADYCGVPVLSDKRITVRGKFFYRGEDRFTIRGTTYGPFAPEPNGCEYHTPSQVDADFALMHEHGFNAVRVYTVPPRWLLDIASSHDLYVLVGLPWEQHAGFLDSPSIEAQIIQRAVENARTCAGHPALMGFALGNEIPAPMVRWYGYRRVEKFLGRMFRAVRRVAPDALLTYVNYPTTEYLYLPFLDFMAMNVYLESEVKLTRYLGHLHNIAGDKPLLLAELGVDSRSKGEHQQAHMLGWQIRASMRAGCAGAFIFAWTDEWYRGGAEITDWCFGLTSRNRDAKPALSAVADAFSATAPAASARWPKVSVVICSYNGSRTIRFCLDGVLKLQYPDYEIIVVDDGSTDSLPEIVSQYPVRLIRSTNQGLSNARNVGLNAATGKVIAYLDDDASPEPDWLNFIVDKLLQGGYVGVGGPNIAPVHDGNTSTAVAHSPGGPIHVLLSDTTAEHIPGCNMAFITEALRLIGGFDRQFRIAGDDVDVCWRLQARAWRLGFAPTAVVWHKRRNSLRAYWRQQLNYGKAEALLERKWPEKYNSFGHISWRGRLYAGGFQQYLNWARRRIYHGTWGTALFQSVYHGSPGVLMSLAMMPEWYLGVVLICLLLVSGFYWHPLILVPLLIMAVGATITQAVIGAWHSRFDQIRRTPWELAKLRMLTMWCHLIQPVARLKGRMTYGLTPWRMRRPLGLLVPIPREWKFWSTHWRGAEDRLASLERSIKGQRICVWRGGDFDSWDLTVRGGAFGGVRLRMGIEEHGAGQQLVRLGARPVFQTLWVTVLAGLLIMGCIDIADRGLLAALPVLVLALVIAARLFVDVGAAMAAARKALVFMHEGESEIRGRQ